MIKIVREMFVAFKRIMSVKVPRYMLSTDLSTLSTGFIPQGTPSLYASQIIPYQGNQGPARLSRDLALYKKVDSLF
jgi:hypothetical protein